MIEGQFMSHRDNSCRRQFMSVGQFMRVSVIKHLIRLTAPSPQGEGILKCFFERSVNGTRGKRANFLCNGAEGPRRTASIIHARQCNLSASSVTHSRDTFSSGKRQESFDPIDLTFRGASCRRILKILRHPFWISQDDTKRAFYRCDCSHGSTCAAYSSGFCIAASAWTAPGDVHVALSDAAQAS